MGYEDDFDLDDIQVTSPSGDVGEDSDPLTVDEENDASHEDADDASQEDADEEGEDEGEEEGEEPAPQQSQKPKKSKTQKRFDALTAESYAKDAQIAKLAEENERLRRGGQEKPPEDTGPPTEEDAGWDPAKFAQMTSEYYAKKSTEEGLAQIKKANTESQLIANRERLNAAFNAKVEASGLGEQLAPILANLNTSGLRLPSIQLEEMVLGLENGPQVLFALGSDLETMAQISRMTPERAAMEIGQIAAKVGGKQKPKPSNAPKAARRITSGGRPGPKGPLETPDDEYFKDAL
jgi:hypothetical protein